MADKSKQYDVRQRCNIQKTNDNYVVAVYNPSLTSRNTITIRTDLRKTSVKVW